MVQSQRSNPLLQDPVLMIQTIPTSIRLYQPKLQVVHTQWVKPTHNDLVSGISLKYHMCFNIQAVICTKYTLSMEWLGSYYKYNALVQYDIMSHLLYIINHLPLISSNTVQFNTSLKRITSLSDGQLACTVHLHFINDSPVFSCMCILGWFTFYWSYIHPTHGWHCAQPYQNQNKTKNKPYCWPKHLLETLDADRADGSYHNYIHQNTQVVHSLLNYIHSP